MAKRTAANDNGSGLDWYSVPAALVIPGQPARVVAVAFSLNDTDGWLHLVDPVHQMRVASQRSRRTMRRNGWTGKVVRLA